MVMSLQLMKQKEKKQRANAKREEKKAAKENLKRKRDDFTDYDDSGADSDTLKNKKKGKKKAEPDSDGEDSPVEITGYIHVLKPTPTTVPSRSRTKTKSEDTYIKRGPFQFLSNCSYESFVTAMSKILPCAPGYIVLEKTEWKPQTPANRANLPLSGEIGFRVLQKQIDATKDHIVIITMPGPRKPTEEAPVK